MVDPDTQLMLQFTRGDLLAFRKLVRRNEGIVLNLAYRYLSDHAEAEDVVQEVFLKVYGAAESYQPRAKFTTWVYRITVNVCLNRLRAARTRRGVPLDASDEDEPTLELAEAGAEAPSARLEREELETKVREAMAKLPGAQRTAVLLRRFDELSYEQIAEVMETTVAAVKSLLARARQTLKALLHKHLG
ncbi:MAG TPA: sigma-70 family RNA polymerase sigma factor [Planctomycetota bacterium]|nr:sigma-70 family RNA polymerase sigma factor [Planctomycetota bacterium]HUV40028.1 sigma-70 family RNA polymerase sigma factor [Planctomycetota bacterium]